MRERERERERERQRDREQRERETERERANINKITKFNVTSIFEDSDSGSDDSHIDFD